MKEVAFIFPGQGRIPSGPPPPSPLVDSLLDLAADLGLPLREWFADRPEERFSATRAAQPALFIDSIARDCALRSRGIVPAAVAGHSLGEYVALVSAGVLSPSDALEIVIERGRLMEGIDGGMAAIVGLPPAEVEKLCADAGEAVTVANYNGPTQLVVAGPKEELDRVGRSAAEAGGRVIPLRVSGPFHSPAMRPAEEGLAPLIERTRFSDPKITVVSGVSGKIEGSGGGLKRLMLYQITSSVRWVDVIRRLEGVGITRAVEVGSGNVLTRLGRRTTEGIEFLTYEEACDEGI